MTSDPYTILGITSDAADDTIRRRYLELVRIHTPERDPERFAAVREAYEKLRDPVNRLRYLLFEAGKEDSIQSILTDARARAPRRRVPVSTLLALGQRQT